MADYLLSVFDKFFRIKFKNVYVVKRVNVKCHAIVFFLSLPLYRVFLRFTCLVHQPMHTHKIVYIKTFKIAPTCFDHAIIIRELRCSLLKLHY